MNKQNRLSSLLRSAVLLFVLFPSSSLHAQEPKPDPSSTLVTYVKMVDVGVTVTDSSGKFLDGLRASDFQVLDNGVERPLSAFALDVPTDVLVLIESGPAVYLIESGHLRAANGLLLGLSGQDRVAVAKYADKPTGVSDFSADKKAAAQAFESLNFNLGFGALNLSDSISTVLDWLDLAPGKKTIVLLSTGVDTSDPEARAHLLSRLRVENVRVLAVSLLGELRTPQSTNKKRPPSSAALLAAEQFTKADETLRELADASGGRVYFPTDSKTFTAAYQEVAQVVDHEYSLGFSPAELDGKVHNIDVRVVAEGTGLKTARSGDQNEPLALHVNHRQAYIASAQALPAPQ
jgi:Ca-activated chloride channel family protein